MSMGCVSALVLAAALASMFWFLTCTDEPLYVDLDKDHYILDDDHHHHHHQYRHVTNGSTHDYWVNPSVQTVITQHNDTNPSPFKLFYHPVSIIGYCIILITITSIIILLVALKRNKPSS